MLLRNNVRPNFSLEIVYHEHSAGKCETGYMSDLKGRALKPDCPCVNKGLAFDQNSRAKVVPNANTEQDLVVHNLKGQDCGACDTSTHYGVRGILVEPIKAGAKYKL